MIKRVVKLYQGDYVFKEGDESEAMYIIENGEIAILKKQGEIVSKLADLYPDDLFGEMAFFNSSKRSASAIVTSTSVQLAVLPFTALREDYKTMPAWIKAVIKSINSHLLTANTRIQELEKNIQTPIDT